MKKNTLFILLIFTLSSYAQIRFEKGYFIDNFGVKTECLIKNLGWKNNPVNFKYKLNENAQVLENSISEVTEFSVLNTLYKKFKIDIDRSSEAMSQLSTDAKFNNQVEILFLKQLVIGKANLYFYEDGYLNRFFYNVDNSEVKQLEFKTYLKDDNIYGVNENYKQQLWNDLKCDKIKIEDYKWLGYSKESLTEIFMKFNSCFEKNNNVVIESKVNRVKSLNVYFTFGVNQTSFSVLGQYDRMYDFGTKVFPRVGIEIEKILSFNRNKWAIFIEPSYQYYKNSIEKRNNPFTLDTHNTIDYKTLSIPIGVRHFMYVNNKSKLFIDASVGYMISLGSNLKIGYDNELNSILFTEIGLGYNYNNRFKIELKHKFGGKDVIDVNSGLTIDTKTSSIILG